MSFVIRRSVSTIVPPKVISVPVLSENTLTLSSRLRTLRYAPIDESNLLSAPCELQERWLFLPKISSGTSIAPFSEQYQRPDEKSTPYADTIQGLGAAKDAVRMARIAKFYEQLPKGPAPEIKASGIFGRYQARYFGKNPSAARM